MFLHERFQTHCQFCFKVLEADSLEQAIQKVKEHEAECPQNKEHQ